jgi:hypothetical protein
MAGVPKLLEVQRLIGGDTSDGKTRTLADGGRSGCSKESAESISLIFRAMSFAEHLFSGPACSGARAESERGVKKGDWFAETKAEDEEERFLDGAETKASASEVSC